MFYPWHYFLASFYSTTMKEDRKTDDLFHDNLQTGGFVLIVLHCPVLPSICAKLHVCPLSFCCFTVVSVADFISGCVCTQHKITSCFVLLILIIKVPLPTPFFIAFMAPFFVWFEGTDDWSLSYFSFTIKTRSFQGSGQWGKTVNALSGGDVIVPLATCQRLNTKRFHTPLLTS